MRFCFPGFLPFLIGPRFLRPLFAVLRRVAPILTVGNRTVVARYLDVVEVLSRDADFTLSQLNGPKIDRLDGPFILGIDRGPQYDRELALLHRVLLRSDLERIRRFVAEQAALQIAAARPRGRIDVVNEYARIVAVRVVATYFGMPGPDEPTMMRWLRDIFHAVFADLTNSATVRDDAARSGVALRAHMDAVIAQRKAAPPPGTPPDDVLGRLLALQGPENPWLDDDAVRRNLAGMIVGAVDTTSKFVALAVPQLLERPAEAARARTAALAGETETVRRYVYEAARFDPHTPLMIRYAPRDTELAAGTRRARKIRAGTTLLLGNISAMFDPDGFDEPGSFDIEHDSAALHFGHALHRCLGLDVNSVQIPQLAAGLLQLENLRLAPGSDGCIRFDGPFPDRLLVEFA
ncbi:MAG: cytochrome P450 [Candidatus Eremiobacteraeota bacterium]|nr:cytochrome P450 [Candidatus Eremiobacteraeota bacterium]